MGLVKRIKKSLTPPPPKPVDPHKEMLMALGALRADEFTVRVSDDGWVAKAGGHRWELSYSGGETWHLSWYSPGNGLPDGFRLETVHLADVIDVLRLAQLGDHTG